MGYLFWHFPGDLTLSHWALTFLNAVLHQLLDELQYIELKNSPKDVPAPFTDEMQKIVQKIHFNNYLNISLFGLPPKKRAPVI